MLLTAAKDVANALTDLVNATKNSSGKSATDPAMETLKSSAKVNIVVRKLSISCHQNLKIRCHQNLKTEV